MFQQPPGFNPVGPKKVVTGIPIQQNRKFMKEKKHPFFKQKHELFGAKISYTLPETNSKSPYGGFQARNLRNSRGPPFSGASRASFRETIRLWAHPKGQETKPGLTFHGNTGCLIGILITGLP